MRPRTTLFQRYSNVEIMALLSSTNFQYCFDVDLMTLFLLTTFQCCVGITQGRCFDVTLAKIKLT